MKENREKLVFSSVNNENSQPTYSEPEVAVNDAFKQEQIRQTQEIPVQEIKKVQAKVELLEPEVSNAIKQSTSTIEELNTIDQPIQTEKPRDNTQIQEPVGDPPRKKIKAKRHMKKSAKIILSMIIIVTIAGITLFKSYNYLNDPKNITKKAFISLGKEINNLIKLNKNATLVGDNYSIDSEVKYKLESQKVQEQYLTDPTMLEYYNLLNNLNNTNTKIAIKHDINKKQFFYNRQTFLNNNLIINDKYLIENSTEYYFVKNFFNNYINDGNNNYFEAITKNHNAIYNIKYIYSKILQTISACVDEEDYKVTNVTKTNIDQRTVKVKKISFELDNAKMTKVLNKILSELKKDKKSFNILNSIINDFSSYKISNKTKFINNNETLTFNFYTLGLLNDTKKYEIILNGPKKQLAYTYETDSKTLTILKNHKVMYYISYKQNSTNLNISITNKNNKKVGEIVLDNTDTRKHITIDFDDNNYDISIDINYKVIDKKSNKYKSNLNAIINIKENNKVLLNGTIGINSNVSNNVKIEEDVKDVTFSSEITKEKSEELNNLLNTRLKKQLI